MLANLVITFRETLEAALVVGIILAYLDRTRQAKYNPVVYLAVASAVVASVLTAVAFNTLAGGLGEENEALFEGALMLFAALLLTSMIFWMLSQRHVRGELEKKVGFEVGGGRRFGLFALVFISVLREGVETVIFLWASGFASEGDGVGNLVGGLLGVVLALVLGYLLFVESRKLDIKKFFRASSVLLVLFAAGLVAHGVHELEEAGAVPAVVEHVWDVNPPRNPDGSYPLLHEDGLIGGIAEDLFGYNGDPSLVEVLSYLAYFGFVAILYGRVS